MITYGAYFCNVTNAVIICYKSCHQISSTAAGDGDRFKSLCGSTLVIFLLMDMEYSSATVATVSTAVSPPHEVTSVPPAIFRKWNFLSPGLTRGGPAGAHASEGDANGHKTVLSGDKWRTVFTLGKLLRSPYVNHMSVSPLSALSERFQVWLT